MIINKVVLVAHDDYDCLAVIKNFIEYIVHSNEWPITQKNILLMLLN